jgi:hypothetical protein
MSQFNLILRRPNLLGYPGTLPGFDLSHPASSTFVRGAATPLQVGVLFSAVSATGSGNLIDIFHGKPSTLVGSPTSSIDPVIGPGTNFPSSTTRATFTGPTLGSVGTTIAFILKVNGTPSGYGTLCSWSVANQGLFIRSTRALDFYPFGDNLSTFTLSVGVPYFVVVTALGNATASSGIINFFAENLNTGQVSSNTITGVNFNLLNTVPTIDVGSDGTAGFSNCTIAAIMYSQNYMSMKQVVQWAQDPWSFWYPQKFDFGLMFKTPTAVVVTVTGNTLPLMGVA